VTKASREHSGDASRVHLFRYAHRLAYATITEAALPLCGGALRGALRAR